ncbi:HAMP domain-containing protein [Citrobacter sp. wls619]|uniref:methyl-accepting chemotaxis protein n=1 Tax=Citrobacter sp. wls619 TaxID=2576432 RepID=UPI0010C9B024|nr:methyl-accepting chemotaxis protein [Citrobacter sp. wls619]TKV07879.1 HAMP domain-containing protein [Citrobacter sp. wls619]
MLSKLKIYTVLNFITGLFALMLLGMTAYSVYHSIENNNNFKNILRVSEGEDLMRNAAYNINAAMANTNGMMVQKLLNKPLPADLLKSTNETLEQARQNMAVFSRLTFNSSEEAEAAADIKSVFDSVYTMALAKLNYLQSPQLDITSEDEGLAQRSLLLSKIQEYITASGKVAYGYVNTAERSNQWMMTLGGGVILAALALLTIVRYWLRNSLVRRMEMAGDMLKRVALGDLSHTIDIGSNNEIGKMLKELEQMRVSLAGTVFGIRNSVLQIHSNTQEIAHGNSDLSSRTEEQAAALQQTAASMEEIKTTVRQNADNAHSARSLVESASTNARSGGEVMHNLERIMAQITESSRQISDINGVIDSIANQTNILALNAAVEAARAGEQGRGFAVVAEEVRNLAKRSADAAKEINQLINSSVNNIDIGSSQVSKASGVMQDIVNSVAQVTEIMGEIASASDEQSAGINQISQAVNEMDLVTQQNAAMVEEEVMAINKLEGQLNSLEKLVATFVLNDDSVDTCVVPTPEENILRQPDKDNAQWETF